MKCPACRGEVALTASICPHCRTTFKEYYAAEGGETGNTEVSQFLAQWFVQSLTLLFPYVLVIGIFFRDIPEILLLLGALACIILALVYRNKLPVF